MTGDDEQSNRTPSGASAHLRPLCTRRLIRSTFSARMNVKWRNAEEPARVSNGIRVTICDLRADRIPPMPFLCMSVACRLHFGTCLTACPNLGILLQLRQP